MLCPSRKKQVLYYSITRWATLHLIGLSLSRILVCCLMKKLSFNEQCCTIKSAYRNLGFVPRNSKNFKNMETLKLLYCSFVRSKLEYAAIVWSPIYNNYQTAFEKVQRKFMKSALYLIDGEYVPRGIANDILLQRTKLCSLSSRRITSSIIHLHKILHSSIRRTFVSDRF